MNKPVIEVRNLSKTFVLHQQGGVRIEALSGIGFSVDRGGCGALMPLMGSPFLPGHAREYAASLDPGPRRDVALSELAYFTGDAAEAAKAADEKIAAIRKDAEAKRAVISERFEQRRAEYADKVFSLVIGAADE